jgi:hypothetical protein
MKETRIQVILRMPPEMKLQMSEAAEEAGQSENKWILTVIRERLAIRDAESRKREDIASLEHKKEMKWEEIIALLAAKYKFGGLDVLTAADRIMLEDEAGDAWDEWENKADDKKPKNELQRLFRDYDDLNNDLQGVRHGSVEPLAGVDDDEDDDLNEPS